MRTLERPPLVRRVLLEVVLLPVLLLSNVAGCTRPPQENGDQAVGGERPIANSSNRGESWTKTLYHPLLPRSR